MRLRWTRGFVVVVSLLAAACGPQSSPAASEIEETTPTQSADPSATSTPATAAPEPSVGNYREVPVVGATLLLPEIEASPGVARSVTQLTLDAATIDRFGEPGFRTVRTKPISVGLTACVDEGGGRLRHDLIWEPAPDMELPISMTITVYQEFGPLPPGGFEVELIAGGQFSVYHQQDVGRLREPGSLSVQPDLVFDCKVDVLSEESFVNTTPADLRYDSPPPIGSTAEVGTLQQIATGDSPTAIAFRELLLQAGPESDLLPERLWYLTEGDPDSISIKRTPTCWDIRSSWNAESIFVRQHRGCDPEGNETITMTVPGWDLTVSGPGDPMGFMGLIDSARVQGVEVPTEEPSFAELAAYEEELLLDEIEPLARIPWQDGAIFVFANFDESAEVDVEAFNPGRFAAGSTGTGIQPGICVSTLASATDATGFAIVAFDDARIDRIEVLSDDGTWAPVELLRSAEGTVGLLYRDQPLRNNREFSPPIRGFDNSGDLLPCVRN